MIRHACKARSGITLTEILISIMIMGVGMVSLATLFPLGLLRLRDAQRQSRSSYLTDAAGADLEARNLLNKMTFQNAYFSPWNNLTAYTLAPYDPWIQDTGSYVPGNTADPTTGVSRDPSITGRFGPGLPVAYDPLWRYQTGIYISDRRTEARFGSAIGYQLRNDPDGNPPSAYGLQRLTNFNPLITYPNTPAAFAQNTVPEIFVSPEDLVLQTDTGQQKDYNNNSINNASPIVPDLNLNSGSVVTDWRFSWSFTGQQTDALNGTIFDGDIVIWENRPFGISQQGGQWVVDGEQVVEAVFGYGGNVKSIFSNGNGFAVAAGRTVLLRWPTTVPDPDVKVGSWIADVTYERNIAVENTRFVLPDYPYQRCHWYQVVKRTQPAIAIPFTGDGTTYRSMTVWVSTNLQSQTLMTSAGQPAHVNAALIAPNVVNVFPKVIYSR